MHKKKKKVGPIRIELWEATTADLLKKKKRSKLLGIIITTGESPSQYTMHLKCGDTKICRYWLVTYQVLIKGLGPLL